MKSVFSARLEKIEATLSSTLPADFGEDWKGVSFMRLPEGVSAIHLAELARPCRELLLRGGKRWRPLVLVLAAELFGRPDAGYSLTPAVEFIHTASLLHDDIEDGADTRRGAPSAYIVYGVDTVINSGSWLFFEAFACIDTFDGSEELKYRLFQAASAETRRLHLGQAMDIYWHRNKELVPSRAEYEAMVRLKTGTLSSLAARLGVLAAGGSDAEASSLASVSAEAGVAFQIFDDVRNLTTGNPGKKRGDDIVEGKKSLPVLIHLEKHPEDRARVVRCFAAAAKGGVEVPEVEECIGMLTDSGAVTEAAAEARRLIAEVCASLRKTYPGSEAGELLATLFESME